MAEATSLNNSLDAASVGTAGQWLPRVYDELRQLAAHQLARQPPGQTLQATALVHEAWLKLTGHAQASWNDRQHFFRAAAEAMRQVLVDHARSKQRYKRGGSLRRINLDEVDVASNAPPEILLLVEEALQALEREHPDKAELVKLRFFVGLSVPETAAVLGVSEKTIKRHWLYARAWLFQEINRLLPR